MHHRDHPRTRVPIELLHQCVVRNALTPVGLDSHNMRAVPARDLRDTAAEVAALPDDHRVARLEQVRDAGLHAGGARAVKGEHEPVRHAIDASQHRDDVQQDLVEVRVEVAEHGPAHRVEHGGVYVRRAGAAQEPLGGPELGEVHALRVPHAHREHKLRVLRNT